MAATWPTTGEEEVYEALVLGTRDYLAKNGFSEALVGLSGGIDSSLVATVAVDALGSTRVHGIAMPSRYSSTASVEDAARLSANLGIDFAIVAIEAAHATLAQSLAEVLGGLPTGLADENLQARIRRGGLRGDAPQAAVPPGRHQPGAGIPGVLTLCPPSARR